jgi:putative component of toxin-antitoxin plasmid stabilization module
MAKEINTLEYFRDAAGHEPFTEWIKALKDIKAAYTIAGRLARLRMGNLGNCRDLSGGL